MAVGGEAGEELEVCIKELEAGSEKVSRSVMHTRVALRNLPNLHIF